MQKNVSVAKQVKSQYWFSWVHLSTESNGQNNVSGFGSPPLQFSFWSIWLCFDLSYIPGIEHSQMCSSIGRLYLYSIKELAVHFGAFICFISYLGLCLSVYLFCVMSIQYTHIVTKRNLEISSSTVALICFSRNWNENNFCN